MSTQRLSGVILLLMGIVLLIFGSRASNSLADRFSEFFSGHFTDATTWYILGGAACTVAGLLMLAAGRRSLPA